MRARITRCLSFSIVVVLVLTIGDAWGQSRDEVVATVNGKPITKKQVDSLVLAKLIAIEQQTYAVRKGALENLIGRAILEAEAKKQGISLAQLQQRLTSGKIEVSEDEVEQIYADNVTVFGVMSPDEARQRIRLDLEGQARMQNYRQSLAQLRQAMKIEVLLEPPRLPPIDISNSPAIGPANAPVTIINFSDFQCPFCKQLNPSLKQLLTAYPSEVRLVFKHMPLRMNADGFQAARAAACAAKFGKFWEYHDELFLADALSEETFERIAAELKLDNSSFNTCLDSEESRNAVTKDFREARRLGLDSTPTIAINGRVFRGLVPYPELREAVEFELKLHAKRNAKN